MVFFWLVPAARAQLAGQDLKEAKKMVKRPLYLRIDAPCSYWFGGVGPIGGGTQVEFLSGVLPTRDNIEYLWRLESIGSQPDADSIIFWGFGPNDAVRYGKIIAKGDTVRVWMEGVPPKNIEVMIGFAQIKTLDDFKKAFDLTFSRVPLQDEHPEWPEEIRRAIAARRVIVGMTKQQAFCVVGMPINILRGEENGVKMEMWFPRRHRGAVPPYNKAQSAFTGFPAMIKFSDGKASVIEDTPRLLDLKLE
jgi:hypothetical protein